MAALRPRGRLRESRYRNESAKPELPLFQRVTPGSGLSICQNPKLQLWADTREVLESPSTRSFCFSLFFHVSWLRSGNEVRDSQNQSQENTLCATNGISEGAPGTSWGRRASCAEWPAWGTVNAIIIHRRVLGQGHGNHLKIWGGKKTKQTTQNQNHLCASVWYYTFPLQKWMLWMPANLSFPLFLLPVSSLYNGCKTTYRTYLLVYFLVKVKHST